MKHASLFSGIGGFDLAAEWMGWTNLFNCEWEEFPRQVLKHHFPNAIQHGDIKELDATAYAGRVDILTGGFPCQPYSLAGKRKGKEDERHLWPEMLRVIRQCAPRYVVGENVRGLVGWNGGMVFEEVCADLEACGYAVQPFLLPAAGVGAPHRRDRVWFVAYANDKGRSDGHGQVQGTNGEVRQRNDRAQPCDAGGWDASDTNCVRLQHSEKSGGMGQSKRETRGRATKPAQTDGSLRNASDTEGVCVQRFSDRQGKEQLGGGHWSRFPTVPPICGGDDGLPKELDGITFSKWRRESIKAYGNAIVPQVALQIFKAIQTYEHGKTIQGGVD
jgi:DNA (cytosine-5)-methyltransferase 1